jgi:hypothetical protein
MNRYDSLFALEPRRFRNPCRSAFAILLPPDFSDPELKYINRLLLVPSWVARVAVICGAFTKTPEISAVRSTWWVNSIGKVGRSKYGTWPRFSPG